MIAYFDNAATTQVCPEAAQAALAAMTENYGNPSSTHTMGRMAKSVLDNARGSVAKALGCTPDELFFTSCGSESDNWALLCGAESMKRRGKHIITSMTEHDAIRKSAAELSARGYDVTLLPPDENGAVSVSSVLSALRDDTILVSLMMVNNETGAVTDISAISKALKTNGSKALLHTDAVQGFLKIPFSAKTLGADMISVSGHKIHAPKGIGALYIRRGVRIPPFIVGGSQESGHRAGTEALPQIAAFGEAARIGKEQLGTSIAYMAALRSHTAERLTQENPGLIVIGGGSAHVLSISMPGYKSEVLMNYLEARGVYVSKSSACKKGGRSHVLEAMGLDSRVIDGAIRISFSRMNTLEQADYLCDCLHSAREELFTVLR